MINFIGMIISNILISFIGMIDRKISILTYQHGGRRLKA